MPKLTPEQTAALVDPNTSDEERATLLQQANQQLLEEQGERQQLYPQTFEDWQKESGVEDSPQAREQFQQFSDATQAQIDDLRFAEDAGANSMVLGLPPKLQAKALGYSHGTGSDPFRAIPPPGLSPDELKQWRYDHMWDSPADPITPENAMERTGTPYPSGGYGPYGYHRVGDAPAAPSETEKPTAKPRERTAADGAPGGGTTAGGAAGATAGAAGSAGAPGGTGAARAGFSAASWTSQVEAPELKFGVQIGNVLTPAAYDAKLRDDMANGQIIPADAKTKSQEYKKWYGSDAGKQTRLEGSQVEQGRWQDQFSARQLMEHADLGDRLATLEEQKQRRLDQYEADRQAAVDSHEEELGQHAANYGRLMDEIERAEIHPFSGPGAEVKAASAIFMLVGGGLGQAMYHHANLALVPAAAGGARMQQNPGLAMVEKMMNDDIARQEKRQANKLTAAKGEMHLMDMARQTFADAQQSRAVTKQAMLEWFANKLRLEAGKQDNADARQQAELTAQLLDRKAADQQLAFELRSSALAQQRYMALMSQATVKRDTSFYDKIIGAGGIVPIEDKTGKWEKAWSKPFKGYVTNEGQKAKAEENYLMTNDILGQISRIKQLRAQHGSSWSRTNVAQQFSNLVPLVQLMNKASGQGAASNPEFERLLDAIGSGDIDFLDRQSEKLDEFERHWKHQAAAIEDSVGLIRGEAPYPRRGRVWIPLYDKTDNVADVDDPDHPGTKIQIYSPTGADPAPRTRAPDVVPGPAPVGAQKSQRIVYGGSSYEKDE